MRTLPSFQEKSIQYQSVNRFPAISSIQGEVVLASGKRPTSLHSQAAPPGPVAHESPLVPWGEGRSRLQAQAKSWRAFRRAVRVAGDAGRRRLQSHSRAGEGEGAQPGCVCSWLPSGSGAGCVLGRDRPLAARRGWTGLPADRVLVGLQCAGRTYLLAVPGTG